MCNLLSRTQACTGLGRGRVKDCGVARKEHGVLEGCCGKIGRSNVSMLEVHMEFPCGDISAWRVGLEGILWKI